MPRLVDCFIQYVIEKTDYQELDRLYLTNKVLALVGDQVAELETDVSSLLEIKDQLVQSAVKNGKIKDLEAEKDILSARLMDLLTLSPSQLNRRFWNLYQEDASQAIADFYHSCQFNDDIRTREIAKNIHFLEQSAYGPLEITINLSKPEKDPKEIAAARTEAVSHYPACPLCAENEGYLGRLNFPARSNHRFIRFPLLDEEWGFQFSPYAYFNEHCIFFDSQHRPMKIGQKTFERLFEILDTFPDYFVGSNADLPIVGGSILSHEHYQGGRHLFPMDQAEVFESWQLERYPGISFSLLDWPMSVIRLDGPDRVQMVELATSILKEWRGYSDASVGVQAYTDGIPHHTVTPIARKIGSDYRLYLVLRDNQVTEEFPDGLFHPHADVHHIKKENIGLIEVMGLAILPPRLKEELALVKDFLLGSDQVPEIHRLWAEELRLGYPDVKSDQVDQVLQSALAEKFQRVLEDAGVFKGTEEGRDAFRRFVGAFIK